jgi:hypothetical protein
MNKTKGLLILAALCASSSARAGGGAEGPALPDLLKKGGEYADRCVRDFASLAAEETWTQKAFQHRNQRLTGQRRLVSDVVYMAPGGDLRWAQYRDTYEVDGKAVHPKDGRLENLFVKITNDSYQKAERIAGDSAQYNIRALGNFDMPTLGLVFMHPDNQARFKWKRKGKGKVGDTEGWKLEFEEATTPAFIGDGAGHDLPSRGTLTVAEDGTLLQSEVKTKTAGGEFEVDVTVAFGPWQGGLLVPRETREMYIFTPAVAASQGLGMRESNQGGAGGMGAVGATDSGEYIETVATYGNFRSLKPPPVPVAPPAEPAKAGS